MTIKELLDEVDELGANERGAALRGFMKLASPMTVKTMERFHRQFCLEDDESPEAGWKRFKEEQDDAIKACIAAELSAFGAMARRSLGLDELSEETQIPEEDAA